MRVLFQVSAVLAVVFAAGISVRQSLHATPTSDMVPDTPCQIAECGCGCADGGPCNCAERAEREAVMSALADISERLDALESEPEATVVVPTPPAPEIAVAPERTADEVMEDLQDALPYDDPDPVDVPLTHDGNGYLTTSAIEAWLASHNSGGSWSYSGGNYGAPLRNHLIRTHGWRESQLLGLSDSELRELHSADHNGRLGPRSDVEVDIVLTSASDEGVPVYFDTSDDYWHWNHGGVNYRWHTLIEGQTYGGRFVYQNGRMCPNGRECSPVTVPQPARTYTPPVFRSSGGCPNCPNGRCPTGGRYGRRWR